VPFQCRTCRPLESRPTAQALVAEVAATDHKTMPAGLGRGGAGSGGGRARGAERGQRPRHHQWRG
jgi:hypothetical protein